MSVAAAMHWRLLSAAALGLLVACGGGGGGAPTDTTDTAAAPVITSASSFSVNEGVTTPILSATATLAAGRSASWSVDGTDAARFSINASTGELSFRSAPDFGAPADSDTNNEYRLNLTVSDGVRSSSAPLAVTVRAWNDGGAAGLPLPPGRTDLPAPSGTAATATNFRVLPWAGFKAAVSYSFDDSSPSHIENWPALKAARVRSTFYVMPSANWFPNYDATWRDAVAQGFELGNHTIHHCRAAELGGADLVNCPQGLADAGAEFDATTAYITGRLGQAGVWTSAYPFGDTGYRSAASTRFLVSRGVQPGRIAAGDSTDAQNLPMIAHAGNDAVSVFNADIDAALAQERWMVFLFHTILPTTQDWGGGEQIAVITGSMAYGKAKGTVWLDSVVNIGAYWAGHKLLQAAVSNANPTTATTWTWTLPTGFPPGRKLRVAVDRGTLQQNGSALPWNGRGYFEVALDAGSLSWAP